MRSSVFAALVLLILALLCNAQSSQQSFFCTAESPNRLPCFINTTFENSFMPDGVASTV
jgi:hypothetical protein